MLDYVIDANILVGMLISGKASFQSITKFYHFYTPAFALAEIEKYQETIFQKTKLQPDELRRFAYNLFSKISIIPDFVLTQTCLEKATKLTKNVEIKDTDYLALAIQLDFILLTRDKRLIKGVRRKGFRKIMEFEEFLSNI